MNSKIENSYKWKLNTLNKRRETQEKKSELLKETHRSKSEKQYQTKLKRLEKRRDDQYKNIVRKEKGKPPIVVKKKKEPRVTKADQVFSLYMRKKYGMRCCTCWGTETLGMWHRITRMCRPLRRDERNWWVQWFFCCNSKTTGNGRPLEMKKYLQNRWVDTEELEGIYMERKHKGKDKPKEYEIIATYEWYKKMLEALWW